MMGYDERPGDNLFLYHVYLEDRVRKDHPLRQVKQLIDFDFLYNEVRATYGTRGNVSVPPPVILKLMLLLMLYNVRSERELMETLPERLDWLWFLGYGLDSEIPDHSVLSKARARWGKDAFQHFFERIVVQCVEAGLVDGTKIFIDASLIDANASNNSVVKIDALPRYLNEHYRELEQRLEDREYTNISHREVNTRHISTTDPDASIIRYGGKPRLRYKTHRVVDGAHEIITAVEVTPAIVNEAHRMGPLIEQHVTTTALIPETVVADSQYGTMDNFLTCHAQGITAHVPIKREQRSQDVFPDSVFLYDAATDTFICPQGKLLRHRALYRGRITYKVRKRDCAACPVKEQCSGDRTGRSIIRYLRQEELDRMWAAAKTAQAKKDLKTRQHLMERSYARGSRYGFDRARWRGLWRVNIQEYLIAAIQNIAVLIRYACKPTAGILTSWLGRRGEQGLVLPLFPHCLTNAVMYRFLCRLSPEQTRWCAWA
jgi:transposase